MNDIEKRKREILRFLKVIAVVNILIIIGSKLILNVSIFLTIGIILFYIGVLFAFYRTLLTHFVYKHLNSVEIVRLRSERAPKKEYGILGDIQFILSKEVPGEFKRGHVIMFATYLLWLAMLFLFFVNEAPFPIKLLPSEFYTPGDPREIFPVVVFIIGLFSLTSSVGIERYLTITKHQRLLEKKDS